MQCNHWSKSNMRLAYSHISDKYRCEICNHTKEKDCFFKSYIIDGRFRCRECVSHMRALKKPLYGHIERIADTLRRQESVLHAKEKRFSAIVGDDAPQQTAFVCSIKNVAILVNNVWGNKSAVARKKDDKTNLVLTRWNIRHPFSAKNSILLTAKQSVTHYHYQSQSEIGNELLYGKGFCKKMENKLCSIT